jgi:hypothetical protein
MSNNIVLDGGVRESLADLAMRATAYAQGHYAPRIVANDVTVQQPAYTQDTNWSSFGEAFRQAKVNMLNHANLAFLTYAQSQEAGDRVKAADSIGALVTDEFGDADFSFLSAGTNAMTFLKRDKKTNHVSTLRICSKFSQEKFGDTEIKGSNSPYLTASFKSAAVGIFWHVTETDPLVLMQLEAKERDSFYDFQKKLFSGTCFTASRIEEIGVLSDGTLMIFDPGEAKYTEQYNSMSEAEQSDFLQHSLDVIKERLAAFDVSPVYNPYSQNGQLKQQKAREEMRIVA